MNYEIPREMFKQRLDERLNFILIDISKNPSNVFKDTESLVFSGSFKQDIEKKFPDKIKNYLLFSFVNNDENLKLAAREMENSGYQFVYYYQGSEKDIVLDKGLN
jgi:hypothetical protein